MLLRAGFLLENRRRNPTFFHPIIDSHTYDTLARAAVSGEGMGPESVWQPLFYPYFLAGVYRVFGRDLFLVRGIQVLIGVGTVYLTYLLGRMLFSFRVGAGAAGLVAISGALIFYEGELLTVAWEAGWFLLSLVGFVRLEGWIRERRTEQGAKAEALGYVRGGRRPRLKPWATWAGVGVVCGVGVVIRPTVLLFYLAAVLWLVLGLISGGGGGWKKALGGAVMFSLGMGLILGPVVVRNYRVTGHWILMPTSGGLNFYIGNNPEAEETITTRPGEGWRQLTVLSREAGIYSQPYGSRYFYGRTFDYIRSQPLTFARGLLKKTILFFNGREVPRNLDIYLFRDYSLILRGLVWKAGSFAFPMGLLLPFSLLGMGFYFRQFRKLFLLYLLVAAYSFAIILFFVTSRYRIPLIPVFSIFAAAGICRLSQLFHGHRWKRFSLTLAFLFLLLIFCNLPLSIPEDRVDFRSELYLALGSVNLREGDLDAAEENLARAIKSDPGNTDALYLLGVVAFERERFEEAEENFQEAIRLHPRHSRAYRGLGRVYDRQGDDDQALANYREAVRLDTGDEESRKRLAELYEAGGDCQAALREYWKVLQFKPDDVPVRRRLAFLLGERGNWETGRELIAEALRHHPRDAALLSDLGVIYGNMGRTEEAIAAFQAALELEPDLPIARFNLGVIHARRGETEKALEQYQQLRELDEGMAEKLRKLSAF